MVRKGQVVGMTGTASRGFTAIYLAHMNSLTESRCHIKASPLLTTESPVAQCLEHPTRSRRVMGSNPIWGSDFSESTFLLEIYIL